MMVEFESCKFTYLSLFNDEEKNYKIVQKQKND